MSHNTKSPSRAFPGQQVNPKYGQHRNYIHHFEEMRHSQKVSNSKLSKTRYFTRSSYKNNIEEYKITLRKANIEGSNENNTHLDIVFWSLAKVTKPEKYDQSNKCCVSIPNIFNARALKQWTRRGERSRTPPQLVYQKAPSS